MQFALKPSSAVQVVLLCGFTLIKPNIPPWYIGERYRPPLSACIARAAPMRAHVRAGGARHSCVQSGGNPLWAQAVFVSWHGLCCGPAAVRLVPDGLDPTGMRVAFLMIGNDETWGVALTDTCCAGGYWALPLQWLTTSIVNNEFLDGELHDPCKGSSCSPVGTLDNASWVVTIVFVHIACSSLCSLSFVSHSLRCMMDGAQSGGRSRTQTTPGRPSRRA